MKLDSLFCSTLVFRERGFHLNIYYSYIYKYISIFATENCQLQSWNNFKQNTKILPDSTVLSLKMLLIPTNVNRTVNRLSLKVKERVHDMSVNAKILFLTRVTCSYTKRTTESLLLLMVPHAQQPSVHCLSSSISFCVSRQSCHHNRTKKWKWTLQIRLWYDLLHDKVQWKKRGRSYPLDNHIYWFFSVHCP